MYKDRRLNAALPAVAACCLLALLVHLSSRTQRQELVSTKLWGGLWSSLDDNVPNNDHVVDIGGDVVSERGIMKPQAGSQEFLPDVIHHPRHAGGVYWGQPDLNSHGQVRRKKITRIVKQPTNGLLYHLHHQRSQPMPAWYNRQHYLKSHARFMQHPIQKMKMMHNAMNAHLPVHPLVVKQAHTTAAHPHVLPSHPLKAPRPAAAVVKAPLAPPHVSAPVVEAKQEEETNSPSISMIAKAYLRAQKLADERKKEAADEEQQKKQAMQKKDELEVKALDQTAASLKNLAEVMDKKGFKSNPKKLAAIAKRLAVVSESLSGSAKDEIRSLRKVS